MVFKFGGDSALALNMKLRPAMLLRHPCNIDSKHATFIERATEFSTMPVDGTEGYKIISMWL